MPRPGSRSGTCATQATWARSCAPRTRSAPRSWRSRRAAQTRPGRRRYAPPPERSSASRSRASTRRRARSSPWFRAAVRRSTELELGERATFVARRRARRASGGRAGALRGDGVHSAGGRGRVFERRGRRSDRALRVEAATRMGTSPGMTPQEWVEAYGRAWREQDADAVVALFTEDADYRSSPFRAPDVGSEGIRDYWTRATSTQEDVDVRFGAPVVRETRSLSSGGRHARRRRGDHAPRLPAPPLRRRRPLRGAARVLARRAGPPRAARRLGHLARLPRALVPPRHVPGRTCPGPDPGRVLFGPASAHSGALSSPGLDGGALLRTAMGTERPSASAMSGVRPPDSG